MKVWPDRWKTSRGDIVRPKPAIDEASVSVVTMTSFSESIGAFRRIIGKDNREADWEVAGQVIGLPDSSFNG